MNRNSTFRKQQTTFVFALGLVLALSASVAAQVADHKEINYPPLQEFEIPKPEIYELDNGMRVFLLEDHELPLVGVSARIRTGSLYEPAEKTGLARIMGQVQRIGGTRSMSPDELNDFLESRAASVETSVSGGVGFASLSSLTDDLEDVFPVFRDVLRYPSFAEDRIDLAKTQSKDSISRRNDSVGGITAREFSRLIYGAESALARMEEYSTIAAISRDDLVAWHERYYHPNNIYLGVVGDFEPKAMKKMIEETFGDWPRGPVFEPPAVSYQRDAGGGVYFIEKSDVTQANIRLGHLGITYDNPDYFSVQVMNEVLSGGFASRLFSRIRSDKGLAYSVGGSVGSSFLYEGVAGFGLQTKSETMGEAVDALRHEIETMIAEPATEDELARAKDSILNSFIFNYVSKGQILGQQMLYSYYGLPLDFLEKYRSNIEKVTTADVARVAEKYLHPEEASLLVVGRSEDFDRPMSSFGEVVELDISIPALPDPNAAVEVSADDAELGRAVFRNMVASLGGGPEAAPIDTFASRTRIEVSMQGQTMALVQNFTLVYPDHLAASIETPMGVQEMVVAGSDGFVRAGGQTQPLPAERVQKQLQDLGRELFSLVRNPEGADLEVALLGTEEVEGSAADLILVSGENVATRLWVNAAGRPIKQSYQGTHPMTGAPGEFVVLFSDYREVDGYWLPHARTTEIDGSHFSKSTVESIEINPPVDMTVFEKPAA